MEGDAAKKHVAPEQGLVFMPAMTASEINAVSGAVLAALFSLYPNLWLGEETDPEVGLVFQIVLLSNADAALTHLGEDGARALQVKFAKMGIDRARARGETIEELYKEANEQLKSVGLVASLNRGMIDEIKKSEVPEA